MQQNYLKDELAALTEKENRLTAIADEIDALLENLDDEEKAHSAVNDDATAFILTELSDSLITILAKQGIKTNKNKLPDALSKAHFTPESLEAKLANAFTLINEEKTLKAEQKTAAAALHKKTKATLETLTAEQADELLAQKWIDPLMRTLKALPQNTLSALANHIQTLADKYANTLEDINNALTQAEAELAQSLSELEGEAHDEQALQSLIHLLGKETP